MENEVEIVFFLEKGKNRILVCVWLRDFCFLMFRVFREDGGIGLRGLGVLG